MDTFFLTLRDTMIKTTYRSVCWILACSFKGENLVVCLFVFKMYLFDLVHDYDRLGAGTTVTKS